MFIVAGSNRKYECFLDSPRDFGTDTANEELKCSEHCQVPYPLVIQNGLLEHPASDFPSEVNFHLIASHVWWHQRVYSHHIIIPICYIPCESRQFLIIYPTLPTCGWIPVSHEVGVAGIRGTLLWGRERAFCSGIFGGLVFLFVDDLDD